MPEWGQGPAWRPIAEDLRQKIRTGEIEPGSLLPSLAQLQDRYDATEGVVRRAITELRGEGWAVPHQGKGVFAQLPENPGVPSHEALVGLVADLTERLAAVEERLDLLERERQAGTP